MNSRIETTLVTSPDICGGKLRIKGTRVTVNQIVSLYKQGEPPEEIGAHFPHLHLAQVYAALTYYHAHREEIETDLEAERVEFGLLRGRFRKDV